MDKTAAWLLFQAVPSITVLTSEHADAVALEWEVAPLLYSFGMTRLVSPWHSFFVVPTERFSGSIELLSSGLVFTHAYGGSSLGGSVQLLAHLPLLERGERLGANVGVAEYVTGAGSSLFVVGGVSTLFGLVHLDARYSPAQQVWMGSLEMRLF